MNYFIQAMLNIGKVDYDILLRDTLPDEEYIEEEYDTTFGYKLSPIKYGSAQLLGNTKPIYSDWFGNIEAKVFYDIKSRELFIESENKLHYDYNKILSDIPRYSDRIQLLETEYGNFLIFAYDRKSSTIVIIPSHNGQYEVRQHNSTNNNLILLNNV